MFVARMARRRNGSRRGGEERPKRRAGEERPKRRWGEAAWSEKQFSSSSFVQRGKDRTGRETKPTIHGLVRDRFESVVRRF